MLNRQRNQDHVQELVSCVVLCSKLFQQFEKKLRTFILCHTKQSRAKKEMAAQNQYKKLYSFVLTSYLFSTVQNNVPTIVQKKNKIRDTKSEESR